MSVERSPRGSRSGDFRFDLGRLDDPAHAAALAGVYPEPVPVGTRTSVFDVYS